MSGGLCRDALHASPRSRHSKAHPESGNAGFKNETHCMRLYRIPAMQMPLFKDKYRTESIRLKSWDYSGAGYYFVTICTKNQNCCLGQIIDGVSELSQTGCIIAEEWAKTAELRNNVSLDEWVIMPNHVHGIICLAETPGNPSQSVDHATVFGPQKNNLASVIRGFKAASTKRIRFAGFDFAWQSAFHDEIIGKGRTLEAVQTYIKNNPLQWELDRYHPDFPGDIFTLVTEQQKSRRMRCVSTTAAPPPTPTPSPPE